MGGNSGGRGKGREKKSPDGVRIPQGKLSGEEKSKAVPGLIKAI